ncbi:MAG: hypothetical protein AAF608_15005 [Pseudomonadota bacterium]
MDPDLILVFSFVIILTAIVGLSVNGVVQKILDHKREKQAGEASPRQVSAQNDRITLVEDRLQVLERIATDPQVRLGAELAQEIEQLRAPEETA